MAKILSHVWSIARGSVGGITYMSGPHGQIIARQRTAPVDPSSLLQSQVRASWDNAVGVWLGLSAAEKTNWENYALTAIFMGATGNYTVTGRALFMAGRSVQEYIRLRGLAAPTMVTTGPATDGFLLPSGFDVTAPAGIGTGIGVHVTADPTDDTIAFINVSKAFNLTRNFWKGPYDPVLTAAVIIPAGTTVVTDFLPLPIGKRFHVRVKCVADDASPRVSAPWYGFATSASSA